jgi:hypothetical protein
MKRYYKRMKLNYLALTVYGAITALFILALGWGLNFPLPDFSHMTHQQYQQIAFINSRIIPLVGILFAVIIIRAINTYRFHVPSATNMVIVGGLLFMVLEPALAFISPTALALFVGLIGMIVIFCLYQVTIYYTRKSVTI